MATLQEQFEAYKSQQQQSKGYDIQKKFEAYKNDLSQGGSISTAPPQPNFPVGATVGGIGGTMLGGPVGGALGTVAGEAIQQGVESAMGDPAAPQSVGQSAQRLTQETLYGVVGEGAFRGSSWLLNRFGLKPFASHMTPEGEQASQYLQGNGAIDPQYLPAEVTDSRILDVLQNVSEYSLLGGGAIKAFKSDRNAFFDGLANQIVDRFGPRMSDTDAGRAVVDAAKRNLEVSTFPAKMIYQAIEADAAPEFASVPVKMSVKKTETPVMKETVKKMTVKKSETAGTSEREVDTGLVDASGSPITHTEEATAPELRGLKVKTDYQQIQVGDRLERLKVMTTNVERQVSGPRINMGAVQDSIAEMVKVAREAGGLADKEMGNTLLAFISQKPDMVSYPVAKAIRTEVRTLKESLQRSVENKNAPAIGKAQMIYGKLTDEIRTGLDDYDPFLAQMWDTANEIERTGQQTFNNSLIRGLIKKADIDGGNKPQAIVDAVWKPNNVQVIQRVRGAVDPPDWNKMQSVYLQDVFAKSMDDGLMNGQKLEDQLFGPKGLGAQALEAGFDKATVKELKEFTNAVKLASAKQGEGTGRVLVQLRQGGVALNAGAALAAGGGAYISEEHSQELLAAGGIILLGPLAIGKVMTSPMGIKWLTEGFNMSNKTKTASAVAGRILQAAFPRPDVAQPPADTAESRSVQSTVSTTVQPMGQQQ